MTSAERDRSRRSMHGRQLVCLLLASTVAVSATQAQPSTAACGVQRWPVKVLLDQDTNRVNFTPRVTTVAELATLPPPEGRTQARRRSAPYELQTFTVRARIRQIRTEPDGDWHLILEDADGSGATLVAEVPDSVCAQGSPWATTYAEVRRALRTIPQRALVDVTGVGFFDTFHNQRGMAPNNFELHPVLAIKPVATAPPSASASIPASSDR